MTLRTYSRAMYTPAQRAWCQNYQQETTFEPLMDDYDAGKETFVEAAEKSAQWFGNWVNATLVTLAALHIPGGGWTDEDSGEQRVTPRPAPHKRPPPSAAELAVQQTEETK